MLYYGHMKKAVLLLFLLTFWGYSSPGALLPVKNPGTNRPPTARSKHELSSGGWLVRVTAYWTGEVGGSQAATGVKLQANHCAVDPRIIPYGSRVILPDGERIAVDTGSAVRSRRAARRTGHTASERSAPVIDLFFKTKRLAMAWSATHPLFLEVKVMKPKKNLQIRDQPRIHSKQRFLKRQGSLMRALPEELLRITAVKALRPVAEREGRLLKAKVEVLP